MARKYFLRVVFLLLLFVTSLVVHGQITIQSPAFFFGPTNSDNSFDTTYIFCISDTVTLEGNTSGTATQKKWNNLVFNSPDYEVLQGVSTSSVIKIRLKTSNVVLLQWRKNSSISEIYLQSQKIAYPRAGNDTIVCQNSIKLDANKPVIGKGKWLSPFNSDIIFQNDTLPTTTASNLPIGKSNLIWQISSICDTLQDTIIVDNHQVDPDAGADQFVCVNTAELQAGPLLSGQTGQWSLVVGIGFSPSQDNLSPIVGPLKDGIKNTFTWTVKDSICEATDTVEVFYNKLKTANIVFPLSSDTTVCASQMTLKADVATGLWSKKKSSENTNLQNWPVTLSADTNIFYWTVENQNCATSVDSVRIINHSVAPPIVRHDTCFLFQSGLSLSLFASSPKAGNWLPTGSEMIIQDSVRANFMNPSSAGHYAFYYKVTNGICKDSAKTQFSLLTKAELPSDICLFVNAGETASVSFRAKNSPNVAKGEKGFWTRIEPNVMAGQFVQKSPIDSVQLTNLPVGRYKYEWSIRDTACIACMCNMKNSDTITITVAEKAKILASGSILCTNNDTVSVSANLPPLYVSNWIVTDPGLGLSVSGKKVLVSKLKTGDNKLIYNLISDNVCSSRDSITITRLTKPAIISDRCYLADVNLRDTITGTPPSVNETAIWRLPQNLAFSFVAGFPNKIVIGKNNASDSVLRYSISGKCAIANSTDFKVTFVAKPKAPSDTFVTLPIISPTTIYATGLEGAEVIRWYGPNGKILSTNNSLTLPDTVAGKYNFRVQKTGKNGCSKEDTVAVTYISNAKILTNYCSKQVRNLNVAADSINIAADTGFWTINPPLLYSYSKFPTQITIAKVDSVGEIMVTWTVVSKKNNMVKVSETKRFVNITKPILSGVLPICAKDSFHVLDEAKNMKIKSFEIACWLKAEVGQSGILKNQSSIVDTIYQLKASSQRLNFVVKDRNSSCADTISTMLNVVTKAIAGSQLCTTDTSVQLSANLPNGLTEYGKWEYRTSTFNKVPAILAPSLPNTNVMGLGGRRTRFAWTIRSKNDSVKCYTTDSLRVIVTTKAKVDLKDECLKGTAIATLQGNSSSLIKGYEKAAWVLAANVSDTISRKTKDTTSKVKIGTSKLYYTVYDSTFKSCRTRDSLIVYRINKPFIDKSTSCFVKQTDRDSIFISTTKEKDNSGMSYSWVKPFQVANDTVFKSKISSADSIHTFILPTVGTRTFYWKVVSNLIASCFDIDSIKITTVSKAKAFATSTICTTNDFVQLVSSNDSNAVETGQWSYLNSFSAKMPEITNANSYKKGQIKSFGERETKLLWKISNKQVAGCFSVDSINTTVVKSTKAKVAYKDTCLKISTNVLLRGEPVRSYENVFWMLMKDTVSRKNSDTVPIKTGSSKYYYTVFDQQFKQCSTKDSLLVNKVNVNTAASLPYCLVLPGPSSSISQKVATKKDADTTGQKYEWFSRSIFSSDIVSILPSSAQFDSVRFLFSETGARIYTRKISVRQAPNCYDTLDYKFVVLPKARAVIDSCLVGKNDTVNLKSANILIATKGEKGYWSSIPKVVFLKDSTNPVSVAKGIQKGKTQFVWTVQNGLCKDSVSLKAISINEAKIRNSDTCQYFDPNLNIALKHDTFYSSTEIGRWKSTGLINIDINNISYNLAKGSNVIQWKVSSVLDSTCFSTSSVSFNLLSPSGFGSDTIFACTRDTVVLANDTFGSLLKGETVVWSVPLYPSVLVASDTVSARLKGLSNDHPYIINRQVKFKGCSLTDFAVVRNQQLDTVFIKPKNSLLKVEGARNSYYTCQFNVNLLVNDPSKDILGASGRYKVLTPIQPVNFQLSSPKPDTGSTINYSAGSLNDSLYSVEWTVSNKKCQVKSDTLQLIKRVGFANYPKSYKFSICQSDTFSFENSGIQLIPNSDGITQVNKDPTSSASIELPNANSKVEYMKAVTLGRGVNQFTLTENKGGCFAITNIDIVNSSKNFEIHTFIDRDLNKKVLTFCNEDSTSLLGLHNLISPTYSADRFRFYWTNSKADTLAAKDTTNLKYSGINTSNSTVGAVAYNKTLDKEKKIYLIAKNGICPAKIDSVSITNYRDVKGLAKIISNQNKICNDSMFLVAESPTIGGGYWSYSDSKAAFSDSTSTSSLATSLQKGKQEVVWWVTNGACKDSDTLDVEVGLPVGNAKALVPINQEVCDLDSLELSAVAPNVNVTGLWYLFESINSSVKQAKGETIKVPLPKAKTSIYKWILTSDICSDTATVTVKNDRKPTVAVVAGNQSVKLNTIKISANEPSVGTGKWEVLNGTAQVVSPNSASTTVQSLPFGETTLKWVISNGVCTPSEAIMKILFTDFEIPEAFSPNGDNKNDKFEIVGLENYPDTKLIVFNRWGKEVFSSNNYKNEWDGGSLDEDTYYYMLDIKGAGVKHGYIVIKRK